LSASWRFDPPRVLARRDRTLFPEYEGELPRRLG
jgi:hypothetical protein